MFGTGSWSALTQLGHTAFGDFGSGFVSMIFDNVLTEQNINSIFWFAVCLIGIIVMIRFIFKDND